jgi:hypothetical protein
MTAVIPNAINAAVSCGVFKVMRSPNPLSAAISSNQILRSTKLGLQNEGQVNFQNEGQVK